MNAADIERVVVETERRWRERTPATSIDAVDPAYRVGRGEIRAWCGEQNIRLDEMDEEFQAAVTRMYCKLRKEFPDELWNWQYNAADRDFAKRHGIKLPRKHGAVSVLGITPATG